MFSLGHAAGQGRCLMATGAEAEALEAAFQARIEKAYGAEFLAWCDELVAEIIAGREKAWADEEKRLGGG